MDVFVYGTLTNPAQVAQVVDSYTFVGAAVLEGLHPVEGRYPTLAPGGSVGGRVLRTDDVSALDAYEGVDRGLYVRVSVPWDETAESLGDDAVAVYVGDPDRLAVGDAVSWPGAGSLGDRVERYVATNEVTVRPTD
ncbi:Gamma-glutamyl cyclotransferase, AIG2-like [Halogranum amylolyticum]|uniref:Gamma-glutamyl cyclotransferase, AIG2-like n=1 Tax=Halogranum amylolyticum TaxID=660520 RepID=A0A1H8QGI5_9EURY|nr:gamma-glutamylcyclotransferase family protein [Halogranum amylolyticum]SEO53340.1 Gamma-glutamyl cyclotransferase, AIG2-like [Halogranum amylolyticum]